MKDCILKLEEANANYYSISEQLHPYLNELKQPDPFRCLVTGWGKEEAFIGEKTKVCLLGANFLGEACELKGFECDLVSEITDARVYGKMESHDKCEYELSYLPTMKGKHQLRIGG